MVRKSVTEAKSELSQLLVLAEGGEEVIITRSGKPVVRLTLVKQRPAQRKFGVLKGRITFAPDFEQSDQLIDDLFFGEQK